MNKIELNNLEKAIKDMEYMQQRIVEDMFIMKDILNKESMKREKNIENATKYAKEKSSERTNIDLKEYPMLSQAVAKMRENEQISNKEHDDLD